MIFDRQRIDGHRRVVVAVAITTVMTVGAGLTPAAERVVLGEYFTSVY